MFGERTIMGGDIVAPERGTGFRSLIKGMEGGKAIPTGLYDTGGWCGNFGRIQHWIQSLIGLEFVPALQTPWNSGQLFIPDVKES